MGKKRRDEYLEENHICLGDFLIIERPIEQNGIRAIPRKKTADYDMLFKKREKDIQDDFAMHKGEIFVDVGSNVGYYALKVVTDFGKDIRVIAIEAHPENYKALCRNVACNHFTNIVTINKAVSERKELISLYEHITRNDRVLTDDMSICNEYDGRSRIDIQGDTLDNILKESKSIQNIGVLKIDVEGAEVIVLGGATETLKHVRKIIVEVHGENLQPVKRILQENNFSVQTRIVVDMWSYYFVIGDKITIFNKDMPTDENMEAIKD